MRPDNLTQLRALDGPVLTKRWRVDRHGQLHKTNYDRAFWFSVRSHAVSSIFELARTLESIATDPYSCVIRGQLRDPAKAARTHRRKTEFDDVPRVWSLHDIDSFVLDADFDWRDSPEQVVRHIVASTLPESFQGATCWWSYTASQGMKDSRTVGLRLAFYHDRPVEAAEWKAWLGEKIPDPSKPQRSWGRLYAVDLHVYDPIQPVFVAKPVFDGLSDPVPRRSGLLRGAKDLVSVPWPVPRNFSVPAIRSKTTGSSRTTTGLVAQHVPTHAFRDRHGFRGSPRADRGWRRTLRLL